MGHCVSYSIMEELETELTFEANKNSKETPFGIKTFPEFNTRIAWDNFDRFAETKSGKNTLHDTVGIAYQIRDIPMTNTTAMHSKKFEIYQWPIQQLCIQKNLQITLTAYHNHNKQVLYKSNNCHRKTSDWLLLLMEQVKTRRAGNLDVHMNQQG